MSDASKEKPWPPRARKFFSNRADALRGAGGIKSHQPTVVRRPKTVIMIVSSSTEFMKM